MCGGYEYTDNKQTPVNPLNGVIPAHPMVTQKIKIKPEQASGYASRCIFRLVIFITVAKCQLQCYMYQGRT